MKDSGVEWIGEIPEHWEVKRLKFLGKAIIGLTYDPSEIVDNQNGTLVLRASNIQDSSLSMEDCVYVEKNIPEKLRTKKDDILICSRNGSKRLIGKNIMLDEKLTNSTFGAFMTVFRSKYANFISKVLNSQIFKSQTGLYSTVTINQLTTSILNNIIIAFPKNELERKQIAEFLDKQTPQFDELIAKFKAQVTLLQEKRQALINHAVTKGLDPTVPMKDSGIEWIGEIPEHWEVKRLGWLCQTIRDINHEMPISVDEGIPFLSAKDIAKDGPLILNHNVKKISEEDYERLTIRIKPKINDVIFSRIGTVGKAKLVETI